MLPVITLRAVFTCFKRNHWVLKRVLFQQAQKQICQTWGDCFPDSSVGKESACNVGDLVSNPGLGRSPGEGRGYPFQYSGLKNSIDYIVPGVAKNQTLVSDFQSVNLLQWSGTEPQSSLSCACASYSPSLICSSKTMEIMQYHPQQSNQINNSQPSVVLYTGDHWLLGGDNPYSTIIHTHQQKMNMKSERETWMHSITYNIATIQI